MDLWMLVYALLAYFILKKVFIWARYLIKKSQSDRKAAQCMQRKLETKYEFEKVDQKVKEAIEKCSTIQDLLDAQFTQKFTCEQLITYCCDRAYRIGRDLNLTADECFTEALELAKAKDTQLQNCLKQKKDPYKELGPLHGIPFSVKDQIAMKGYLSTMGVGSRADYRPDFDANIVTVCKDFGAIPISKGNVPVTCLSLHSTNKCFGTAKNPWNNGRTCGGSSGGDAASLLFAQFSFGSDLGGSLRAPASFNGVVNFMPTAKRQNCHGNFCYTPKKTCYAEPLRTVIGPFAKNTSDVKALLKVFLSEEKLKMERMDPKLAFNESVYKQAKKSKFRIGIITNYETVLAPCPTAKRLYEEAISHLHALGHQTVEIEIPDFDQQMIVHIKLMMGQLLPLIDKEWYTHCDDIAGVGLFHTIFNLPEFVPNFISKVLKTFGQSRLSDILQMLKGFDKDGFLELCGKRELHLNKVSQVYMKENLDAILNIPTQAPAFQHEIADDIGLASFALRLAIYWQFPSATIPCGVVQEDEQKYEDALYNDSITASVRRCMQDSKGLPMGLEVIGTPFKDEIVLAIIEQLEAKIEFSKNHPFPKYE